MHTQVHLHHSEQMVWLDKYPRGMTSLQTNVSIPQRLCLVLKAIDVNSIKIYLFPSMFWEIFACKLLVVCLWVRMCASIRGSMNSPFVMRVMKIKHKILTLINFCHNTWHRHSSQKPMNSWVTQCFGYGPTKAGSYEKIKEDFRWIQNKLCYRRNLIWPFTQGRLILIISPFCLLIIFTNYQG